jgi:hypothetical protein
MKHEEIMKGPEKQIQHLVKSQILAVNAQANQLNDINAERPQYQNTCHPAVDTTSLDFIC